MVSLEIHFRKKKTQNDLTFKQGHVIWFHHYTNRLVVADVLCATWLRTSDNGSGRDGQGVTRVTTALLQSDSVELRFGSIQELLGLLV